MRYKSCKECQQFVGNCECEYCDVCEERGMHSRCFECDAKLCVEHAHHVGPFAYCEAHVAAAQARKAAA